MDCTLSHSVLCSETAIRIIFFLDSWLVCLVHLAGHQMDCYIVVRKEFSTRSNWQDSYPPCDMGHESFADMHLGVP